MAPDSGTTAPAGTTTVDVTFDSTGMAPGNYSASLCVNSNDPATPLVEVPVDMTVVPHSAATNSSLCIFDRDDQTTEREFRLLFTPDVQNWPQAKLSASNPGQFYYNVFRNGAGPMTFDVTVPYPFVTQGSMPVHVYDDVSLYVDEESGDLCFMPEGDGTAYATAVTLADHVDTDGDGKPDSATFTVADGLGMTGFAYVAVHLDYGLKHGAERYLKVENPDGTADAIHPDTLEILIADRTQYDFSATANGGGVPGDSLVNDNEFKNTPGVAGFVWNSAGGLEPGVTVRLVIPEGVNHPGPHIDGVSDEDGWYMINYKHKGRPTDFQMEVWQGGVLVDQRTVNLKGNEYWEENFTLP